MTSYRNIDWKLVSAALALTVIGIFLVYSAHYASGGPAEKIYFVKQVVWLGISLVWAALIIQIPIKVFDLTAYIFYGAALLSLVAVLLFGHTRLGATRWFDFGPISVTPSDIAKAAILLALARFLAYSRKGPDTAKALITSGAMTFAMMILILKQPDLGTSLVFSAILVGMWFWAGVSPALLALILSPLVSLIASVSVVAWILFFIALLAFMYILRPRLLFASTVVIINLACGIVTPFVWNGLEEYQRQRILVFLDPGQDPRGAGYQIIQSQISIGSGGLSGKGFMQSTQSRLEYLPERHTDFIFSILGEEWGLLGVIVLLALFAFLLYRLVKIASRCRSRFSSNVAFGAAAVILFQALVNIGMTLGVMPVTGLPLPFVSYGGTSLLFFWTLIGLALSADASWQEY